MSYGDAKAEQRIAGLDLRRFAAARVLRLVMFDSPARYQRLSSSRVISRSASRAERGGEASGERCAFDV